MSKDKLSPEDALAFNEMMLQLNQIDLTVYARELADGKSGREKLVETLKANKKLDRGLKGRGLKRKKQSWQAKKAYRKRYNEMVGEPRRKAKLAEELEKNGWYPYLMHGWKKNKMPVKITAEEWNSEIAPLLGESIPVVRRYDTKKPVCLYNCIVYDSNTRAVLYDGAEAKLRELGMIL